MVTRPKCQMCQKRTGILFHVPKEIWEQIIHPSMTGGEICIMCFDQEANEKMIEWEKNIKFYPTSLVNHLKRTI